MVIQDETNNQSIVEKDIEALYLGNLRTIEFDLDLPKKGKFGSTIQWQTSDERFITSEGKVSRPSYGKGDRTIQLTAIFKFNSFSKTSIYEAKVLEEENNIVVKKVYPVHITQEKNKAFYLPQVVSIMTEQLEIIPHAVVWENGEKKIFSEIGTYLINGKIKDTTFEFQAHISIVDELNNIMEREKKVLPFNSQSVRLKEGSMSKIAQDNRLKFLLSVNDDQMLYNFREASGLNTKNAPEMIGWDSPDSLLKGHTTGHYLSSLALCYGCTGNEIILEKIKYMITELNKVQLAFETNIDFEYGFLSGYSEEQFDLLEEYVPYPKIWAPYYTLHKILAGLLDIYQYTNNTMALTIADKLGDWTYNRLSKLSHEKLKKMWGMYIAGEFGGINESLASLFLLTKKNEHLKAARLFDNDRLFFPMEQKVDALGSLHANQHIPQIIGALKIYDASKIDTYYQIADFFWKSVTSKHIYSIGGTGDTEMFQQPNLIGEKISEHTAESCASYNMLKLTKELYEYEPTAEKMDYYERTVLNHILASTDHECLGASTYFMPTTPGAKKGFDVENSCCHGTGLENHFKYTEAIYFHNTETVFINLFLPSILDDKQLNIKIDMDLDEAKPEKISLTISKAPQKIAVRNPYWSKNKAKFMLNGKEIKLTADQGYYFIPVNDGDKLEVEFTPSYRLEATPDVPSLVSLGFGPYILAAINNETDYLPAPNLNELKQEPMKLTFKAENTTFVPLAKINHEHYHLYLTNDIRHDNK